MEIGCVGAWSSEKKFNSLEKVTVTVISPTPVVRFGTETPSPVPINAAESAEIVSDEFASLRDRLAVAIREEEFATGVDIALAVTDLQTSESIQVDGNEIHLTGCVINLFAFLTVTKEFEAGKSSPVGREDLISKGINHSQPPAVRNFLVAVFGSYETGLIASQNFVRDLGLGQTVFDHVPYYGGEDPSPNLTTASDTNTVLTKLWRGEIFSPDWTRYALSVLGSGAPYLDVVLPAYFPEGVQIAHKVGWFSDSTGWVENDVGIVTFTGEDKLPKSYVISFLSQSGPKGSYAERVGSTLSKLVWDYFDAKY